jgi:uncharacterized integral membrane protein
LVAKEAMKAFLKWLLLAPIALLALVFAIANRHVVTVVFNPFGNDVPGLELTAPLFIVLLLAVMFGVVIGGFASWLAQGRYRRAVRQARADLVQARADMERVRAQASEARGLVVASRSDLSRPAA